MSADSGKGLAAEDVGITEPERDSGKGLAAAISGFAEDVGITEPERITLDLAWNDGPRFAGVLARIGVQNGLYRIGADRSYATISESGQVEPMTADRLAIWVGQFCNLVKSVHRAKGEAEQKPAMMPTALARQLLQSDPLKEGPRELDGVFSVPMPAWSEESKSLRLLAPGYDPTTKVLILPGFDFDQEQPVSEALGFLMSILRQYPWFEADEKKGRLLDESRSFAAQICLMLGEFGRLLLPEGVRPPLGLWVANRPGSGKSTLARMVIAPVHGEVYSMTLPERKEELDKLLATAAINAENVLFFDDVERFDSPGLRTFVTGTNTKSRKMGTQTMIGGRQIASVFAAGNNPILTVDMERRCIMVDLFAEEDAKSRSKSYDKLIDARWVAAPENRAAILSALWALLKNWENKGCPACKVIGLPSFELYSQIFASVVVTADLADPTMPRDSTIGGDEKGRALGQLLRAVAGKVPDGETDSFPIGDLLDIAEKLGIDGQIVPASVKDSSKSLGKSLSRLRGSLLIDDKGREFLFAGRDHSSRAAYPITILTNQPDSRTDNED